MCTDLKIASDDPVYSKCALFASRRLLLAHGPLLLLARDTGNTPAVEQGYYYKTNHRKPSQTTTNYRKPPQTTSNHHKPPPEFETIGGENDEKQANHRKPPQTTTRIRVKKESNCQFCGLNLVMARRNIIDLCHSCCLHDFSICKQLFYIEKHWHVCNNQEWVCVAPPIEYAWCQFKMTSSKCPYRSKV